MAASEGKTFKIKGTLIIVKPNLSAVDSNSEGLLQFLTLELISASKPFPPENGLSKHEHSASLEGSITPKLEDSASVEGSNTSSQILPVTQSKYIVYFDWSHEMGIPGAFVIRNLHSTAHFYLVSLTIEGISNHRAPINFVCRSWVYPDIKYKSPRVFFINKSYLPRETPKGLRKYREQELKTLRGDGTGERQEWERIYDYAFYNDLGKPDQSPELARPVLGGSSEYPYPRRGRTGRPSTQTDPDSESRLPDDQGFSVYVPRDDRFGDQKLFEFVSYFPKSLINSLKGYMKEQLLEDDADEFVSFEDVRQVLFKDGFKFSVPQALLEAIAARLPIEVPSDGELTVLFPTPSVIQDNLDGWMTDEEFAREMLAGVNPGLIRLLQEFPLKSQLDTKVYGDQTSKITKEHLEKGLCGLTVDKALNSKRLFILDHHDSFMPYLRLINETSRKAYASRTILFLKYDGTLKPLAIELSLPHPLGDEHGAVSKVYLPANEGVEASIWQLVKAYVIVNDSGYHQLISHWLNTHAAIEPFVIAANRQLSVLHPIYKLLHPHFHDTMFINALARQNLISADGIIESSFLPGKYSMVMSSAVYKNWNFLEQALPADLIKRGMAVNDKSSPHGLRLVIEDYPFAVDGLDIWDAIKKWVHEYVFSYYETDDCIKQDIELQSWWKELVEVGHADLKDKDWWPKMQTCEKLIECCTIIIWISSALHAAVNFGQFPYGGYILNRPTLSRRFMPEEGTQEYEELVKNPQLAFLKTITPKFETLLDLSVIEILSGHTTDEVYLGTRDNPYWTSDVKALDAFKKFGKKMAEIEKVLTERNEDPTLLNRVGPIKMPYTLLYPTSEPGLTARGIPNSISI